MVRDYQTINAGGTLLSLHRPLVMGIINLTTDSFYVGSRVRNEVDCLTMAVKMWEDGADILDLGAMSSKPGSRIISPDDELDKLLPAIRAIKKELPQAVLSVDTLHSSVAKKVLDNGAHIINDISGGVYDPKIMKVTGQFNAPYIIMHMKGLPENMQNQADYDDVVMDVLTFFKIQKHAAHECGIEDVVLDPGFGFGKTLEHNYELLNRLDVFQIFDCPVLAGISRKSMIWKPLGVTPEMALNGTTALHMAALMKGTGILRVHDVREAREVVQLFHRLNNTGIAS